MRAALLAALGGASGLAAIAAAGHWRAALMVASCVLATSSTVPYIRQTIRRSTRPRLVTWATWSLLTGLAGTASAAAGDIPSAVFSFVGTAATAVVVMTALRFGDRAFGVLDGICLGLVAVGAILWPLLQQPAVAVITACLIDFIGLIPTAVHAWRSPHEETTSTFALIAAAGLATAAAAWGSWSITSLAYPVYVAVSMGVVAMMTTRRPTPATHTAAAPQASDPAASGLASVS